MSTVFDSVEWDDPMSAPTEEEIAAVENSVNVNLPADFIEFCEQYHGGYPDPDEIEVEGFGTTMVNSILPFVDVPDERIRSIATVADAVDGLSPKLVPFAFEPGGNYFCFDYRSDTPKVVFWHHEQNTVFDVCASFTEFVEILANS